MQQELSRLIWVISPRPVSVIFPNMKTVQLCKRSKLMENAFKVLLVNLQKEKKLQQCVLMNQHHVDRWNSIVKTLKIAVNN